MIQTFPTPKAKSLGIELPALEKTFVEFWVVECLLEFNVLIENETEDGEEGEDGGVAQHEHPIVDGDGHEVENACKNGLYDGYYQSSVNHELRQHRRLLVSQTAMPKQQFGQMTELRYREVGC